MPEVRRRGPGDALGVAVQRTARGVAQGAGTAVELARLAQTNRNRESNQGRAPRADSFLAGCRIEYVGGVLTRTWSGLSGISESDGALAVPRRGWWSINAEHEVYGLDPSTVVSVRCGGVGDFNGGGVGQIVMPPNGANGYTDTHWEGPVTTLISASAFDLSDGAPGEDWVSLVAIFGRFLFA